ncbi:MAG: dipeptidase [Limisphaerales bacterium]
MTSSASSAPVAEPRDEALWQRALALHRSAIVVDGHNDITGALTDDGYDLATPSAGKHHTDLPRLREGGVSAVFFAVFVDHKFVTNNAATRRALAVIDATHREIERHPNDLVLCTTAAEIRAAKQSGRIAALLGAENGAAIEDSLATLRAFHRLGVRYLTLTHMQATTWADASTAPPQHNGLTEFGRSVVREMNRLGMMVDVSHVSDKTMSDVLDLSTAPIIASHSSARALAPHPRNIPDDLLKRIAAKDGIAMVNFYPGYIDPRNSVILEQLQPEIDALRARWSDNRTRFRAERRKLMEDKLPVTPLSVVIDHIEHIIKVAGVNHVGLGSDFDGISLVPADLRDVSMFPNLTYELLKRGHSEADVRKILGENFLRVFAEVERRATTKPGQISGGNERQTR